MEATTATGHVPSRLYYVTYRTTGTRFLVDTGVELSVIPRGTFQRKHPIGLKTPRVANGSCIATYCEKSLTLDLDLRRPLPWIFIIADEKIPILGADFLSHFSLATDMKKRKHLDTLTSLSVTSTHAVHTSLAFGIHASSKSESPIFNELLKKYLLGKTIFFPQEHSNWLYFGILYSTI